MDVATHCPYCAPQCGMTLRATEGRVGVHPRQFPTNRGGLCQKGWTAAEPLDHPDRLTSPLLRDRHTGELRPATWDEALGQVAATGTGLQAAHGRDAIAVFGGGGLTNEKAYALGKFARVALRTRQIDYNGRFCMSSAAAAGNRAFGIDRGLPFPLADLGRADTLVLVGANVAETMPPLVRYLVEQKQRDEWRETLDDPDRLRRFASFVNAPDTPDPSISFMVERGQPVPASAERRPVALGLPTTSKGVPG